MARKRSRTRGTGSSFHKKKTSFHRGPSQVVVTRSPPARRASPRRRAARLTLTETTRRTQTPTRRRTRPHTRYARTSGGLQDRPRNRRDSLQRAATRRRVPKLVLSTRLRDEDAPSNKATSVCARKKSTRRAVVIANGYGGINNARQYRKHKSC